MSIYVLRYGDLLKIGYSSNLATRVKSIMAGIPGDVSFVGHMPGEREMEAHLHQIFAAARFSGEWFKETEDLRRFCEIALLTDFPIPAERIYGARRVSSAKDTACTKDRIRSYALTEWPDATHAQRISNLSGALNWRPSRVKDFYYGDGRAVMRSIEASHLALLIAPELGAEISTETPKEPEK